MSTLHDKRKTAAARAVGLIIGKDEFIVCFPDGHCVGVPYGCFPRLASATAGQRGHFEICAQGRLLHWPEIDEDIEVQHIAEGRLPIMDPARGLVMAESRARYGKV